VDRAARRVAAEEKKKKKDAEKAWARERRRARDALEKLRRRQEREGLPREPSPETPDDDDDDEDDDEEDDMAARLGLSPGLGFGQEPSGQLPSRLTPSVPGVGASGSRPEGQGQPERAPDPSAGGAEVTPEGQARASAPREPPLAPAALGGDPQVTVTVPGQSAPRASKARVVPKLPAKRTSAAVPGVGIQETSPQSTVDHGPERVSILECLRPGFPFICLGRDFSFFLSKRSHGLTDLAPRKALKTTPTCAASAAPGLAVQPTLSQGIPPQGARAAPVAVEQVPEAGSSAEAAIVIVEAVDADVVPSPPDVPAIPAPAATEAVAVPVGERPVAADVKTADVSALGASEEGAWRRDPSRRAAASSLCGRVPRDGASCSGSGPVRPRTPSSFSTMNGRTSPGMSSASVLKQRWGRSGRRWRFSAGTSQKSSR
jgi:hypothetical protein